MIQTRLFFLFCLSVMGCSNDSTQGLADGGEQDVADDSAVELDTSIVPDTGTVPDVGADLAQNLPRERIPCVPNDEPVVCDNTRRGLGFEPTDTGSLFPWDCIEVGSLFIEWSGDPVDGPPPTEFPDLEQLTPLESAGIEMAVEMDPHDPDSDFYPLNLGLKHVDGLRNLKQGGLRIRNNVDLEDLDGLCNLKDVTVFSIEDCPKLKSLRGLRNIRTYERVSISIRDNPSLPPEEVACLRKALTGIAIIRSDVAVVECPPGYWGEDTP